MEDCERNDGSAERPYFMSKRLMDILAAENAAQTYQVLGDDPAVINIHFNKY